jgi:hypothetical protein
MIQLLKKLFTPIQNLGHRPPAPSTDWRGRPSQEAGGEPQAGEPAAQASGFSTVDPEAEPTASDLNPPQS